MKIDVPVVQKTLNVTFTPAELAAADAAFALHKEGKCDLDCGFCFDLLLSDDPRHHAELKWLRGLKNKPNPLPAPKRGKGNGGLKGRVSR